MAEQQRDEALSHAQVLKEKIDMFSVQNGPNLINGQELRSLSLSKLKTLQVSVERRRASLFRALSISLSLLIADKVACGIGGGGTCIISADGDQVHEMRGEESFRDASTLQLFRIM